MLLNETDIEELFDKKCCCFGAAVATGMATAGVAAGSSAALAGAAVTSTIFTTTGAAVAANLALMGTAVSAMGMIQQGQAQGSQMAFQAGVANNNAIIAQQQATRARQQARIDSEDYSRGQSDLMAKRRSLMGDTGTLATTGSPLAVSSDFAGESVLNTMRLRNQGEVTANRLEQEVMNQRGQAGLYGMQGRQAVKSSYYKAGGSLFKGGSDIWRMGK
jgi:hypothetical protein